MVIKISCLFLGLVVSCSCLDGGATDASGKDPELRAGLTAPARDDPVPKIEPLALIRPQGFRGPGYNPGPEHVRFGVHIGEGGYPSRQFYPGGFNPGPRAGGYFPGNLPPGGFKGPVGFVPGNVPPGGFRGPGGFVPGNVAPGGFRGPGGFVPGNVPPGGFRGPGGFVPGNIPPGGFRVPGGFVPGNIPPGGFRGPIGWNQGFGGPVPFRQPFMNTGPANYGLGQFGGPVGPYQQRQGPNIGPGGPGRPDFHQRNNRPRDKDQELDLDDLPEGTVGVNVAAVNQTDQGTVYAEITAFVVPNEETSPLDSRRNQNTAQNILEGLLNQDQRREKKKNNNVEDILDSLNLPKR